MKGPAVRPKRTCAGGIERKRWEKKDWKNIPRSRHLIYHDQRLARKEEKLQQKVARIMGGLEWGREDGTPYRTRKGIKSLKKGSSASVHEPGGNEEFKVRPLQKKAKGRGWKVLWKVYGNLLSSRGEKSAGDLREEGDQTE